MVSLGVMMSAPLAVAAPLNMASTICLKVSTSAPSVTSLNATGTTLGSPLAQVVSLFESVHWVSAEYPSRLYKALMHSSTVFTAWDGDRLVGLLRAVDDSELVAYLHYALVHPDYQGHHIAGTLIEMAKEKYRDYLYINLMPEESKNAAFYQQFGFEIMPDGVAMQKCNFKGKY